MREEGSGGEILTTSRQSLSEAATAARCWAMDRNIGKIGCFKIVKFWQLTKGFVWNQIFLQPSLTHSLGLWNGLKALKMLKHVSRSDLLCFQGSSLQRARLVFLKCGCFIIILQQNPFNPCPSPRASPQLVSPGVSPISPCHQIVDTIREKDCMEARIYTMTKV